MMATLPMVEYTGQPGFGPIPKVAVVWCVSEQAVFVVGEEVAVTYQSRSMPDL